ncbi:hypothetical protein MAR_035370 [Mya arenaria]|uniref:Uncharacterized protein n=1 Tax=Mya arenaria TaxID=6604 RepID=A0ABY7EPH0_MYAAR|nr:hypothetical protein MAR_035370 [Mya arenaria]
MMEFSEAKISNWEHIPLEESYVITEQLDDGSHVRVWLRATDAMNNTAVDYTEVHVDNTPPRLSDQRLQENVKNGTYTYTSRLQASVKKTHRATVFWMCVTAFNK